MASNGSGHTTNQAREDITWGRALSTQAPENFVELRGISNEQLRRHKPLMLAVFLESALKGSRRAGTNAGRQLMVNTVICI